MWQKSLSQNELMSKFLLLEGKSQDVLKQFPDNTFHAVVTSPPYWSLRDYFNDDQLGQESTPEEYVKNVVSIMREVKRTLRKDGAVWFNIGDSYNNSSGFCRATKGWDRKGRKKGSADKKAIKHPTIKTKDLIGMPWRVAFALQEPYVVPTCVQSEVDRAWLASLFDADGCLGIRRFDSYRKEKKQVYQDGYVAYTTVGNSDVEILDKCIEITNLGKVNLKTKAGSSDNRGIVTRRDNYNWRLDGNSALEINKAIYPYLVAKKKQACLIYTLDKLNKKKHDSKTVPKDIQNKKEKLYELIKKCNQREPVDLPSWVEEPKQEIEPGWYLRCDIGWEKTNPMPDGAKDRPTRGHEYIFLLTKSPQYFYDYYRVLEDTKYQPDGIQGFGATNQEGTFRMDQERTFEHYGKRNRRAVWRQSVSTYRGKHFATYPPKLITPCVQASTSEEGCCVECGTPWVRTFEKVKEDAYNKKGYNLVLKDMGFHKDCKCKTTEKKRCLVLDPFNGTGTTGEVAITDHQNYVGIELNKEYLEIARERLDSGDNCFSHEVFTVEDILK